LLPNKRKLHLFKERKRHRNMKKILNNRQEREREREREKSNREQGERKAKVESTAGEKILTSMQEQKVSRELLPLSLALSLSLSLSLSPSLSLCLSVSVPLKIIE
jgi:hypothetical protein